MCGGRSNYTHAADGGGRPQSAGWILFLLSASSFHELLAMSKSISRWVAMRVRLKWGELDF